MIPWIRIDRAARVVRAGGVVAYPTEGVYGLGCLPFERKAVERIVAMKRRPIRKGFVLVAAGVEQLEPLVVLPSGARRDEILASWPGPVTWVLPARPGVPDWLGGGRPTLAVRVTAHPIAQALSARVGEALISTSANVSDRRPLETALAVRRVFGAAVDDVLAGPVGGAPGPTEIKDGATGRTLRPAAR